MSAVVRPIVTSEQLNSGDRVRRAGACPRPSRASKTSLSADQLDHSLRRIEELARVTLEDQGVNPLFMALGMLKYRESTDSESCR